MKDPLVTVVEHPNYLKQAEKLLVQEQMDEIADTLAANPRAGEIMQGTGGFRKMRYAGVQGKGKSGGMRVIHLYVTKKGVVHLLHVYGKGDKDNLNKAERNELAQLAAELKE
jgi:hypothetical protein